MHSPPLSFKGVYSFLPRLRLRGALPEPTAPHALRPSRAHGSVCVAPYQSPRLRLRGALPEPTAPSAWRPTRAHGSACVAPYQSWQQVHSWEAALEPRKRFLLPQSEWREVRRRGGDQRERAWGDGEREKGISSFQSLLNIPTSEKTETQGGYII